MYQTMCLLVFFLSHFWDVYSFARSDQKIAALLQIFSNRNQSQMDQVVAFLLQPSGMSSSLVSRRSGLQIALHLVVSHWVSFSG